PPRPRPPPRGGPPRPGPGPPGHPPRQGRHRAQDRGHGQRGHQQPPPRAHRSRLMHSLCGPMPLGCAQPRVRGGSARNMAQISKMGLPVPHGFTVTCEACNAYRSAGRQFPDGMLEEVAAHLEQLEQGMGRRLGDPEDPLLVSVRSGAPFSMPGMMDSVLNLGLNDQSVEGLTKQTGSERFAWDSYRRLLQMYGRTVMGVEGHRFEE